MRKSTSPDRHRLPFGEAPLLEKTLDPRPQFDPIHRDHATDELRRSSSIISGLGGQRDHGRRRHLGGGGLLGLVAARQHQHQSGDQ